MTNKADKRRDEKRAAGRVVLVDLLRTVGDRIETVDRHKPGSEYDTYRKEILRLWRVALRAVKAEAK